VDNATNQRIMMTSHEVTLSRLEHKKHHAMEGTRVRFTPTAQRFGPARPGPLMVSRIRFILFQALIPLRPSRATFTI